MQSYARYLVHIVLLLYSRVHPIIVRTRYSTAVRVAFARESNTAVHTQLENESLKKSTSTYHEFYED